MLSTDFWITHSHDGGLTFPDENRLTPSSFDMRTAPYALGYFVGDYTGLAHFGADVPPGWVGSQLDELVAEPALEPLVRSRRFDSRA